LCGRFLLSLIPAQYAGLLRIDHVPILGPGLYGPRMNIAPTQQIIIARCANGGRGKRELAAVVWGMIPPWAGSHGAGRRPIINARSETAWEKPLFKDAARNRRCVIPADGFYEWRQPAERRGRKQPYLIRRTDNAPMFFAGIWSASCPKDDPAAPVIERCAILTTMANEAMAPIHDRMPVMLSDVQALDRWLSPEPVEQSNVADLLRPCPGAELALAPTENPDDIRRTKKRPDNDPQFLFE